VTLAFATPIIFTISFHSAKLPQFYKPKFFILPRLARASWLFFCVGPTVPFAPSLRPASSFVASDGETGDTQGAPF